MACIEGGPAEPGHGYGPVAILAYGPSSQILTFFNSTMSRIACLVDVTRLLLPDSGLKFIVVSKYNDSEYGSQSLRDQDDLPCYSHDFEDRACMAFRVASVGAAFTTPELIRIMLSDAVLDVYSYKYLSPDGQSIIHSVAQSLGWSGGFKYSQKNLTDCGMHDIQDIHGKIYHPFPLYIIFLIMNRLGNLFARMCYRWQ